MKIELNLNKIFSHIAGKDYGQKIYQEQIKQYYDGESNLEIWFPLFVKGVSISFVQGLIKEMVDQSGKQKVLRLITLRSDNEFLNRRLERILRF